MYRVSDNYRCINVGLKCIKLNRKIHFAFGARACIRVHTNTHIHTHTYARAHKMIIKISSTEYRRTGGGCTMRWDEILQRRLKNLSPLTRVPVFDLRHSVYAYMDRWSMFSWFFLLSFLTLPEREEISRLSTMIKQWYVTTKAGNNDMGVIIYLSFSFLQLI